MSLEEWRPFQDYEISNWGNVRSNTLKSGGKLLTCSINNKGYKYFQQFKNGKRINHLIHHLVAKLFLGERPDGLVIDHIDRNPLNNKVDNLRYITQSENCKNQNRYRVDILETDKRLRANILQKERETKQRRDAGVEERRPKGTGQLYQRDTGNWRGVITINKIRYDKTFKTKKEAEEFLSSFCLSPPQQTPAVITSTS